MDTKTLARKRLRKTAKFSCFLQAIPFVEALLLNGSLAQGKTKKSSDIDILVITKRRRLYTARFFVIVFGFLSRQKRSKDENKPHAGKFCFNYFLSDDFLKIPAGRGKAMDKYCADNYSRSVLIWGDNHLFARFLKVNEGLFSKTEISYKDSSLKKLMVNYFPITNIIWAQTIKKIVESLLAGCFGDWLEAKLKHLQIGLINRDYRTKKYPNLIVCDDKQARFHPPKNSRV